MELIRGGMELGDLKASETIVEIIEYFVGGVHVCGVSLRSWSEFDSLERSMVTKMRWSPGDFVAS